MVNGHPESTDDTGLEAGNAAARAGKRILFTGGTNEKDAAGERLMWPQRRLTGKRDAWGEIAQKTVMHPANIGIELQHLNNTLLRQRFELARQQAVSEKAAETERVKHDEYDKQCVAVSRALSEVHASVTDVGTEAAPKRSRRIM